jgi:nickel transport protein
MWKWLLCLALASVPRLTQAHDIWLEKQGGALVLFKGHKYSTHTGPEEIPYSPDEILRSLCFDMTGKPREVPTNNAYPFQMQGGCAASYVLTSSGYWSKTPFGTKHLAKDEARQPIRSWLSYESVKRLDAWNEKLATPLTDDLELTPTKNPLPLSKGKKVRLLVTRGGQPLAGALVSYGGKTRGQSDSDGRVNIRLKQGGLQLIQASFTEAGDGQKADEFVHSTTLVFELGAQP